MRCVIFQFLYVAVLFIAIEYAFAYKQGKIAFNILVNFLHHAIGMS